MRPESRESCTPWEGVATPSDLTNLIMLSFFCGAQKKKNFQPTRQHAQFTSLYVIDFLQQKTQAETDLLLQFVLVSILMYADDDIIWLFGEENEYNGA